MQEHEILEFYMDVRDMIALCHIIDEFENFNKNILDYKNLIDDERTQKKLYDISKNRTNQKIGKINRFYQENKLVIDTINKYSSIYDFINFNYSFHSRKDEIKSAYKYISKNKDKLDNIIAVLTKLNNLGIFEIRFNEIINYENRDSCYTVFSNIYDNYSFSYLENIEIIPSFRNGLIRYKTKGSHYKIDIDYHNGKICIPATEIELNSLTFDCNKLPNSLTEKDTFNKIIELTKSKKNEYDDIEQSVYLNIYIEDLYKSFENVNSYANQFLRKENREELFKQLLICRQSILNMQEISKKYDEEIIKNSEYITKELLREEKEVYKRKRERKIY